MPSELRKPTAAQYQALLDKLPMETRNDIVEFLNIVYESRHPHSGHSYWQGQIDGIDAIIKIFEGHLDETDWMQHDDYVNIPMNNELP